MIQFLIQIKDILLSQIGRKEVTFTIANAADTSGALNCANKALVGILMPSTLTSVTFDIEGSIDGINFFPMINNYGSGISAIPFVADTLYSIDPSLTLPYQYVRIVTASNEDAERTFTAITRFIS